MKKYKADCYYIDLNPADNNVYNIKEIKKKATEGVKELGFLLK